MEAKQRVVFLTIGKCLSSNADGKNSLFKFDQNFTIRNMLLLFQINETHVYSVFIDL